MAYSKIGRTIRHLLYATCRTLVCANICSYAKEKLNTKEMDCEALFKKILEETRPLIQTIRAGLTGNCIMFLFLPIEY